MSQASGYLGASCFGFGAKARRVDVPADVVKQSKASIHESSGVEVGGDTVDQDAGEVGWHFVRLSRRPSRAFSNW
jgi:hypothetical protein